MGRGNRPKYDNCFAEGGRVCNQPRYSLTTLSAVSTKGALYRDEAIVLRTQKLGEADRIITMLQGAMAQQRLGNPAALCVDIGPVIDRQARDTIDCHIETMRASAHQVFQQARQATGATAHGPFVTPTLIEIGHIGELQREVFGPVLHVVRYRREELDALIEQINGTGYGLTFGVHTRIDETIARAVGAIRAGNIYVNRNMVCAVVGVQPFGGEGLSGTGPKAGGPLYLYRLLAQRPADAMVRALEFAGHTDSTPMPAVLAELRNWANSNQRSALREACDRFAAQSRSNARCALVGPTGENNLYSLHPREAVLNLAELESDRLIQLAATLAVGCQAVWPAEAASLRERLPQDVRKRIALAGNWQAPAVSFDAVLYHGPEDGLREVCRVLAQRPGPIVGVQALEPGDATLALERLVIERSLSINTAAAGGYASLMSMA